MKKITLICSVLALHACAQKEASTNGPWFQVPAYMKAEIAALKKANPAISKTLVWGDELRSAQEDSVDWDRELAIWERMDLNKAAWSASFDSTVKQTADGGRFVLYESRDQKPELRSVSLLYDAKEALLVIEADWEEHHFWMHRSYRLSYLPGKGYTIKGWQQGLWEARKEFEIFADIQNDAFLNH